MSWLYRNSAAWRGVVHFTRQGALNMALFSLAITAVAWYGGTAIMERTNPAAVPEHLQRRQSIEHKMLARANKERLAVLLDEVKGRSDNSQERYAAALRGESLGTHSTGSSRDAVAIKKN